MTTRKPYRSDLSDAGWALIEPELAAWRAPRPERKVSSNQPLHDVREIVNTILYINRTGCAREYLPHDFPPFKTVYGYFAAWRDDGTSEHMHDVLRRRLRRARGRTGEPSAAAIDSQTVGAAANTRAETVGYDGNKKTKGRKRHIAVDTFGLLIVLGVSAASLGDSTVGRQILDRLAPSVTKAWRMGATTRRSSNTAQTSASTSRSYAETPSSPASRCCHAGGWSSAPSAGACCADA